MSLRVLMKHILKNYVPNGTPIISSLFNTLVKTTEIPNLWNLKIRFCINGKPIIGFDQYVQSYTPVASADSIRLQLEYYSTFDFLVCNYDFVISN